MKRAILISIFVIGATFNMSAQITNNNTDQSPQELYNFHISKQKSNNLAAWLTLGGGAVMVLGGLGWNTSQGLGSSTDNNEGLWLSYLGGATMLTSIPLFIAKGKHKRKAKIQLQNGAVGLRNNIRYSGISVTVLF